MPKSFLSRKVYLGIPFYERRKPIDFIGSLERYKTGIRQQVIAEATPAVTTSGIAAVSAAINSLFSAAPYGGSGGVIRTADNELRGYGQISAGAGYKGGTSPAAQAILAAAKKAQSINKSTVRRK